SRNFGVDAAVLSELVNGAAVSNHAKALGLRLSDQTIATLVRNDPVFQGGDQKFSRQVFDERIRQVGLTEQQYLAERRNDEIRQQLTEAMLSGVTVPDTIANVVHKYREETRTVSFIRLDPAKAPAIGEPDEKALKAVYDEQKRTFITPERRKIGVLLVTPDELKQRSTVTDDEVKSTWEQSRPSWDIPERRRIQRIVFKTKAEAEAAIKSIEAGKSFLLAALAADPRSQIDSGLVARREIGDANFAKAAFEIEKNKVSAPVQVRGGYLILRVTEIDPARTRSFDEVKDEVRQGLEETKRRDALGKLHDEIEDKRGATVAADKLKQIAAELKLKYVEASDIDAQGNGPDGKPALAVPDAQKVLAAAFEGDKSTPREAVALTDGGEAWVDVLDVKPAEAKPFDAVKADVVKLWQERETKKAIGKQAQELTDKIKSGTPLETVAKELGLKVETTKPFKRGAPPEGFSGAGTRQAFSLAKGAAGNATSGDDKTRLVFVVAEITEAPAATKEQVDAIKAELGQEMQRDDIQAYLAALRERQGVKVNEAAYRRAVGLDQQQ
ncbi:MAG: peptidyl-prolyl cis-trans isomerase, partial [Proteobacteria bacterium]|nr:peptidyl-prolyl cis-trans isomerase [Pseudomonadota bacterium]